jgi:hypothetical protein
MNRQRKLGSFRRVSDAPRIRTRRAPSPPTRAANRRLGSSPADGAVLALLSELLIGDSAWTMAEVQRLVELRDRAELGRWRADGLGDDGASTK